MCGLTEMKRTIFAIILLNGFALTASPFSFTRNGVLQIEQNYTLKLGMNYTSTKSKFNYFTQTSWYRFDPKRENGADGTVRFVALLRETEHLPDTVITSREVAPDTLEMTFDIEIPAEDFNCGETRLEFTLPIAQAMGKTVSFRGKSFTFPEESSKKGFGFGSFEQCDDFVLPLTKGDLRIQFSPRKVATADGRFFDAAGTHYTLRIPMDQTGTRYSIQLRLTYLPYEVRPLAMKSVFNRTFADPKANDKLGGWTDQGPEQDLGMIKPGRLEFPPARFDIASDKEGNSCLVLGGGALAWLPKEAVIPCNPASVGTIFLLHAIAWAPGQGKAAGELIAAYSDGTESRFQLRDGVDVANWWLPERSYENARLVWRDNILSLGESRGVGLFLSSFHTDPAKRLTSITLRSQNAVWMTAAMALSPQKIQSSSVTTEEFTVRRSKTFLPYKPCLEVERNSALDFSFMQDAPAGKYGFLKTGAAGDFRFEKRPETPFRIFGTNVCFETAMLDKAYAELMVRQLKAFGYNAVRLHHFDRPLCGWETGGPVPEKLDALFYTLAELKKAGIYYSIDLYTARKYDLNAVPEIRIDPARSYYTPPHEKDTYNLAAMLFPSVRNGLKEFTRTLLCTVNPYTGMALKDDPALITISILNENSMLISLNTPLTVMKEQYLLAFDEYCRKQNRKVAEQDFENEFNRFALEIVYRNYYEDMVHFLRKEIGTKALLTDQNFVGYPNLVFQREWYDFTDEHHYSGDSVLNNGFKVANGLAKRVFGKPFVVSESGYTLPAPHRAEGGLTFPAIAAFQNWQGIYAFAHANRADLVGSPLSGLEKYDRVNDPVRNIPERIACLIFLRGDVSPLTRSIVTTVGYESSLIPFQRYYPDYTGAGVFGAKVGSMPANAARPFPADAVAVADISKEFANPAKLPVIGSMAELKTFAAAEKITLLGADKLTTPDGEVSADLKSGIFKVVTPRTEGFFFKDKGGAAGNCLAVSSDSEALVAAGSLDGKELAASERVLLVHVTDMENENTVYTDSTRRVVVKSVHKQRPVQILFRAATAKIEFKTDLDAPKLYALDCGGKRLREIPYEKVSGRIRFNADTNCGGIACFAYELTK